MAAKGEPLYYSTFPPEPSHYHQPPPPPPPPQYILLPLYYPPSRFAFLRRCLLYVAPLILLAAAIFFLWPFDPDVSVVRLRLNHVHITTSPHLSLDISLPLTVKVRNRDFFSLDYSSLVVSVGYRGRQLGFVTSDEGHLRARGSSFVDATLQVDGIEVFDVLHLLEDLTRGFIPFETVTEVRGKLGLFFFEFPLKAKVSCEVHVNMDSQTIVRQSCFPE